MLAFRQFRHRREAPGAVSLRRHFAQQAVLIVDLHGAARFRLAAQGRGRIVGAAAVRQGALYGAHVVQRRVDGRFHRCIGVDGHGPAAAA